MGMGGGMEGGADLHLLMLGRLEQHPAGLWWESFVAGAERGAHRLTETPGTCLCFSSCCALVCFVPILILSSKMLNG